MYYVYFCACECASTDKLHIRYESYSKVCVVCVVSGAGTSRLRVALSAAHSEQDIVDLVAVLHDAKILPRNQA